jgi:hypothetical protein
MQHVGFLHPIFAWRRRRLQFSGADTSRKNDRIDLPSTRSLQRTRSIR